MKLPRRHPIAMSQGWRYLVVHHLGRKTGLWFVGYRLRCYLLVMVMLLVGSLAVGVGFHSRYL